MKKVGIVTFHRAHNYGAILQAYALQEKIKSLGHDISVINYNNDLYKKYNIFYIDKTNFKTIIKSIIRNIIFLPKNIIRYKNNDKFMNEKLVLTKKTDKKQTSKICCNYDAVITGSDQVWNEKITHGLDDIYSLNIPGDFKRISYAASLGHTKLDDTNESIYTEKLNRMNNISVREKTFVNDLEGMLKKDVNLVMDPTFLINGSEWEEKISSVPKIADKYIFVYSLGKNSELTKTVEYLKKKTKLKVVYFGNRKQYAKDDINIYTKDAFVFLKAIKDAEYVIANSYHATIFSIIFKKNFMDYVQDYNLHKIKDLLNLLNIKNKMFSNYDEFIKNEEKLLEDIDYDKVYSKLEPEIDKSTEFLKSALER